MFVDRRRQSINGLFMGISVLCLPMAGTDASRVVEEDIAISIIPYMEVFQGLERSPNPQEAHVKFQALVDTIPVMPLSIPVAQRCARLGEASRRRDKRVNQRALDLIIAATVLEHDFTLVTRNISDYDDIPDVRLYQPG